MGTVTPKVGHRYVVRPMHEISRDLIEIGVLEVGSHTVKTRYEASGMLKWMTLEEWSSLEVLEEFAPAGRLYRCSS